MKTIRITKVEGKGGLIFDTMVAIVAFEMELSGRVTFIVEEGSTEHGSLSKAAANPDHDYDQLLPALRGAAFRILEEGDYKVVRILKLKTDVAKEIKEAIVGSGVKVELSKELLDSVEKDAIKE